MFFIYKFYFENNRYYCKNKNYYNNIKKYLVLLYNGNKLYNRIYKFIRR